jgi:hypothetical protein
MDRFALTIDSATGTLVADTSKVIVGPSRGSTQFLTPPKGPSCKTTA